MISKHPRGSGPGPVRPAALGARLAWAALAATLLLGGCSTRQPAPVEDRSVVQPPAASTRRSPPVATAPSKPPPPPASAAEPETRRESYTVKRGDTLYLIALDHGLDYRELAAWNSIQNPDRIFAGQVLRLSPPGESSTPPPAAVASAPSTGGVTTAPLRTTPPVVASDGKAPSTGAPGAAPGPMAGAAPGGPPGSGAHPSPDKGASPPAATSPPPLAINRNSDTYKTQPKAVKEPYSERALREMQQRFGGGTLVASAASSNVPSSTPPSATPPVVSGSGTAPGAPAPPAAAAGNPAAASNPTAPAPTDAGAGAPPVIARADPKLDNKSSPAAPAPSGAAAAAGDTDDDKLEWVWPATGKLVTGFSDTANLKGIDIAGKSGQPVLASAAGKVVYAGSGLRGYGKLIIIKHNKNYLSAYAHNKDILVKEGQQVSRGQKIAEMGNSDADQVKLHFEIRRLGKPMDPLKYLPPA